ncbi:hypothetical protein [Mesorhizobium sp. B2-8-3]|uniref:hypothetical protein n=1 Tax=Mesorhizobium sp. B2-8-3 TaxID=2589905 RepID=UPI0011260B82|nr:hypothetical protein [Mesorhizobium sp. B2-8-3]TPJ36867.1 hypothetical protein FJ418_00845 [Mesorhizobium sp. B2-8-3]
MFFKLPKGRRAPAERVKTDACRRVKTDGYRRAEADARRPVPADSIRAFGRMPVVEAASPF